MNINYKTDLFEHERLTPIVGKPDYISLQRLKKQIKANVQAVPSTLGGGTHGMLGLVISDVEYATVSAVPFVREPYPGALAFPTNTTNLQSKVIEDTYKKSMKRYESCIGVDKAIRQQIVKAIHEDWLKPLRDPTSDMLQGSIPDILQYLFTHHGDVSADALDTKETEVKNMHYDPEREPLDKVFTEVDQLSEFATAAGIPYSRPQKIKIAYLILKRLKVFNQAITKWNANLRATPANNTWANFKTYFRQEYEDLKEVNELTVGASQFGNANLVSQIVEAVQDSLNMPSVDTHVDPPNEPNASFIANNTTSIDTNSDPMTALMQQMMLMNNNMWQNMQHNRNNNNNNQSGYRSGRGSSRGRGRNGRGRGRSSRPRTMRYCWTCGWTYHDGAHCRTPAEGHKPEATIDNRMGGSVECVPPGYGE